MKVGTTIYNEGCKKLTTEFDMKSSGTIVYTTNTLCSNLRELPTFGSTINIIHQYGQINMVTLQTQCEVLG